jgi:carboxypeptidase PM20D1
MKKILGVIGGLVVLVAVFIFIRTLMFTPSIRNAEALVSVAVDEEQVTTHMAEAIRFRTVSVAVGQTPDYKPFTDFVDWTRTTYPAVQENLQLTMIADYTMLYRWQGDDAALKPILLTAHYDTVPVVPGSESDWTHPPFSGVLADDHVWGRGALDDKSGVIVMLEALTLLLQQDFVPRRTVYFSFSHDEERGGIKGAKGVTEYLQEQNIQLAWSLDEGSFIVQGLLPGSDVPVASINVAEKGSVTLDLIAHGEGGHSSMPAAETSVDILAQALVRLRQHPVPGGLDGLSGEMLDAIAREGSFLYRLVFANKWLFGTLIEAQMAKSGGMNAMIRTTTAPTILSAGIKTNVIPPTAKASVNFRLHPRDTVDSVILHVKNAIADDRVDVVPQSSHRRVASKVSSRDSAAYRLISSVTRKIYGDVIVVPGLTLGGTDSKHYSKVADNSYRYQMMVVGKEDIAGFHGTNERVSIENLVKGTAAYYQLLKEASAE